MNNYVNYRNGATARLLPGLLSNVALDLNVAKNLNGKVQATWDQWNNLYNAMNTHYCSNGAGAGDVNWAVNWEWNTANVKRDEIDYMMEKRQACSQPTAPSSSSGVAASSSETLAPSGSVSSSAQPPSTAPSPASGTGPGFTGVSTGLSPTSTASVSPTRCMSDGAPWLSPTA